MGTKNISNETDLIQDSKHELPMRPPAAQAHATKYYTYRDLLERLKNSPRVTPTDYLEYENVIIEFTRYYGKGLQSKIDEELQVPHRADEYFESITEKLSAAYLKRTQEVVTNIRKIYVAVSADLEFKDNTFSEMLKLLRHRQQPIVSINVLAQQIGIPTCILARWEKGTNLPHKKNLKYVTILEQHYQLQKGTLRKKLGRLIFGTKLSRQDGRKRTNYSRDCTKLQKHPYGLSYGSWPDACRQEFQRVLDFYTLPEKKLSQKMYWRSSSQRWRVREDGICNTGNKFKSFCEHYFGYLTASPYKKHAWERGLGLPKDVLSIALLANVDLLGKFADFLNLRHRGKDTTGTESYFKMCLALLRAPGETNKRLGYFRQESSLFRRYFTIDKQGECHYPALARGIDIDKEWQALCDKSSEQIVRLSSAKNFVPFRNKKEPIKEILDQASIHQEIATILRDMRLDAELTGITPCEKAKRYRNFMLALFLFLFEMRSHMYSSMEIGRHIYKVGNTYRLKIFRSELKCPEAMDDDEVVLDLPPDVSRYIHLYLKEYRSLLYGSESPQFFTPCKSSNIPVRTVTSIKASSLSREFSRNMSIYSSSPSGFGAHAVRYLIGTVLDRKRDLPDFVTAATMALHSKEMQRDHYSSDQIRAAFKSHIKQLQQFGVLEMPENEVRYISVDENEYNRLKVKVDQYTKENAALRGQYPHPLLAAEILG